MYMYKIQKEREDKERLILLSIREGFTEKAVSSQGL